MSEQAEKYRTVLAEKPKCDVRLSETMGDRLAYCRKMLWIHGMLANYENREVTTRILNYERRQAAPQEPTDD